MLTVLLLPPSKHPELGVPVSQLLEGLDSKEGKESWAAVKDQSHDLFLSDEDSQNAGPLLLLERNGEKMARLLFSGQSNWNQITDESR